MQVNARNMKVLDKIIDDNLLKPKNFVICWPVSVMVNISNNIRWLVNLKFFKNKTLIITF